jgi:hypothetical protein
MQSLVHELFMTELSSQIGPFENWKEQIIKGVEEKQSSLLTEIFTFHSNL